VLLHHEFAHHFFETIGLDDVGVAGLAGGEDRPLVIQQRRYRRTVDSAVLGLDVVDLALEFEVCVVLYKHGRQVASLFA
jgi:hypothetical protein